MWEKNIIPHAWKCGIICPIHKKGEEKMCDICRAVTFLRITYQILANILYVKLVLYAEEIIGEYQGGFGRGRSTVDKIFTMREILENIGKNYRCTSFIC
jgi:hypothetical protein